jgi:type II secretory pathway component PulC
VQKSIWFLLLIFALAVAYSIISLDSSKDANLNEDTSFNTNDEPYGDSEYSGSTTKKLVNNNLLDKHKENSQKTEHIQDGLPYEFTLVGISKDKNQENSVLIKFENDLYTYEIDSYLLNSTMKLVNITDLYVDILFEQVMYKKELTLPNLLSKHSDDSEKSYSDLMNMTAKEIGSRPRIIEHLLVLIPTPYIADGKLASPGLNPALFNQAGFRADDVLKTINGKSVTIESEFDEIKNELKTAQTLMFVVMRKGRLVTLYLDIPSDTLELRRD